MKAVTCGKRDRPFPLTFVCAKPLYREKSEDTLPQARMEISGQGSKGGNPLLYGGEDSKKEIFLNPPEPAGGVSGLP
jgi:hypothetical protein